MSLPYPFPIWVVTEQMATRSGDNCIVGHP